MTTPFDTAILTLKDIGFFHFVLPFILSAAIFYGLLRKTQLFGPSEKNIAINATISLVASFFVWSMPVLLGINITEEIGTFFVQGMSVTLVAMIGLLVGGMFLPPDLPKIIGEKFKSGWGVGAIVIGGIVLGIILLISSGLYNVFSPNINLKLSDDAIATIVVVALLVGVVAIIVRGTKG